MNENILFAFGLFCGKFPFRGSGEACAAPAPQAGFSDNADNLFGRHFGNNLAERFVAVKGNIFFDFFRVDYPAVLKCYPKLFFIKVNIFKRLDFVPVRRFVI